MPRQQAFDMLIPDVLAQPRASRDEVVGMQGGRLKVRVAAAPVDGKGNEALIRLLAREFGVAKSQVSILSGARSRNKRIGVRGLSIIPDWMSTLSAGEGSLCHAAREKTVK
uniref:UPF0235 protein BECKMB1821G_GA0114241_10349 n=1 Tax=Candidatus Kentrum sp. MB TaxID=2138164 RepID=A0A451BC72_9GAMM|nr:MAG: hypothetical protein BECKMB1821G_GA0114241_10349 [Candidatus Kentron sp. MB]VFK32334.1 MAG: hypothetical protein BECKMB1821I_GA0114274_10329 [Candidatus Kentron sp. MB]VFK75835.1 MAG: hypothetical protein BECKMB1821H_GA0114242_10339 [Candidatus Kentron sp. MB]